MERDWKEKQNKEQEDTEKEKKELKKKVRHKRGTNDEDIIIGCPSIVCYSVTIGNYWNVL
jgi:hypothetical protein